MKHRSAAMLLFLAAWSCALQPAAGRRPRPEPPAEAESAGGGRAAEASDPAAGALVGRPASEGGGEGEGAARGRRAGGAFVRGAPEASAAGDAAGAAAADSALAGDAVADTTGALLIGAVRAQGVEALDGAAPAGEAASAEALEAELAAPWVDPSIDLEFMALQVLAEANKARILAGSGPLVMDAALRRAARRYSRELALRQEVEHHSSTPGRRTFRQRIAAEGAHARVAGENLARLTASVESLPLRAVQAWLRSPGHRRNLLDPIFTRTGIGVMLGRDGVWYVAQVYATPR